MKTVKHYCTYENGQSIERDLNVTTDDLNNDSINEAWGLLPEENKNAWTGEEDWACLTNDGRFLIVGNGAWSADSKIEVFEVVEMEKTEIHEWIEFEDQIKLVEDWTIQEIIDDAAADGYEITSSEQEIARYLGRER